MGVRGTPSHERSEPIRERRRWWRGLLFAALAAVALLVCSLILALIPALGSVQHLQRGRAELSHARAQLLDARVSAASEAFDQGLVSFRRASSDANNALTQIPAAIPLLGRSFDALRTLAEVGEQLAATGADLTRAVASLPGGPSALGPRRGRLPLDVYARLAPTVGQARADLEAAQLSLGSIATSLVPAQIVEARGTALRYMNEALPAARSADELLRWLPSFAGVDGRRSYLVAAENPAELRGTGGLITMYSILTLDQGRIRIEPFRDLPPRRLDPSVAVWPSASTKEIYASFDAATVLHNTNVSPDVPTSGTLLLNVWKRTQGTSLDGVLFVDTQAIRYLLQPLGRVHVPGLHGPLTPGNVVRFMTNTAYAKYPDRTTRKALLGSVGTIVFTRFFHEAHGLPALRAVGDAASKGLFSIYATDRQVEEALRQAGLGGRVAASGTPMFGVYVNNIGGNKLDYYLHVDVTYDAQLLASGSARVEATIALRNDAPRHPPPGEVFGPYAGAALKDLGLVAGETYLQTSFYCGGGCTLLSGDLDGDPLPVHRYEENGLQLYSTSLRIMPQRSRTIRLQLSVAHGWSPDPAGDVTTVQIRGQALLNPLTATVRIQAPEGRDIAWSDPSATVSGSQATWELEPAPSTDVEIGF